MKAVLVIGGTVVVVYALLSWRQKADLQARINAGVSDLAAGRRTPNRDLAMLNIAPPTFRTVSRA